MRIVTLTLMLLLAACGAFLRAADPPQSPPSLKLEIREEILFKQRDFLSNVAQLQRDQQRLDRMQKDAEKQQEELQKLVDTAVERSGLDPKKWQLDPVSLNLRPKPQPPKAETGGK